MHIARQLAQATVDAINSTAFSQAILATRSYSPRFDLTEMDTLHVTVIPIDNKQTAADRKSSSHETHIEVAVQQKVDVGDTETKDALVDFVGELADFLLTLRYASPIGHVSEVNNNPIQSYEHDSEMNLFTSVLQLTIKSNR